MTRHVSPRGLVAAIVLCGSASAGATSADARQPAGVVLSIAIEQSRFASDAKLLVQIWNAAQLDALESNAACTAGRNSATGATEMRCPPGVVYQQVSPQEYATAGAAVGERLELAATGVRAGERFRVRVAGTSADRCNTTSGEQTSTAEAGTTRASLVWETTSKACGRGGGE
jgi:hypothetical protein